MWRWISLALTSGREWQCWGTGNLLIVECQINTAMEKKGQSRQVPNLGKKKRRRGEKSKDKGMQLRSLCMITVSMSSMKG